MWLSKYILLLYIPFVISMEQEAEIHQLYSDIVKIITDYSDLFRVSHIFIARNKPAGDLAASTAFLTLLRHFSKHNVFSMITTITEIPQDIVQGNKQPGRPFFIVFVLTMEDFENFSEVTKTSNLNPFQVFVIFRRSIRFCQKPDGNPFNLVFDTKMLVKCQGESIIREWYSLHENKTEIRDLLSWKPDVPGFKLLTNLSFQERRSSLHGLPLRVTLLEDSILEGERIGFFGSVIKEVAKFANFKIELQPYESNAGSFNPITSEWNGVMKKLMNKKTDIGVGEFTMTVERLDVVDFSDPVVISRTNFYLKEPQEYHLQWSMYFKAHGLRASYCLALFILISPIIVALTMIRTSNLSFSTNVYDNYFQVWGIFCNKSPTEFPENSPTRIAYYSLFLLGFVLYSIYSALLVSYLTNMTPDLPFNSIDEFIARKSHRITTLKNTSYVDSLKISDNPEDLYLKNFLLDEDEIPQSLTAALEQACDDNQKIVLYIDEKILRSITFKGPCKLIPFVRDGLSNLALAFVQDSPYVKLINYHLRRMRDSGILHALEARNLKKPISQPPVYKPVNLWSTVPIFGILYFGMILSIVALIIEHIFYYNHNRLKCISPINWHK